MATIHKFTGEAGEHYSWEGQRTQDYGSQPGILEGTFIHWLIGKAESAPSFAIRYFELPPTGTSTPEQHPYEHGNIVVRGRAKLIYGETRKEVLLEPFDVVYIPPDEFHHFVNESADESFGAFCTIPAYRRKGDRTVYAEGDLVSDVTDAQR